MNGFCAFTFDGRLIEMLGLDEMRNAAREIKRVPVESLPLKCSSTKTVKNRAPSLLPTGRKMKLVWNDEFDGDRLDVTKWSYRTNFWGRPKILLETMAGKGSEVGRTFEELKQIMDMVELKDKLGVCMDTCHVYDAGYNIVEDLDGVLEEFDRIIGIDKLCGIHLNDSKNPYASHKDRHEKIGQGSIGLDGFSRILNHPVLKNLPFYLETPNELDGYKEEIALLRSLCR